MNIDYDPEWISQALQQYTTTRDSKLRDQIVERSSWLAIRSARRFSDRGEPFDDLVQVANIGLIKAVDRFDPSLDVPFAAYATPTIIGEIRRYFRDRTWGLHVPRRVKDAISSVNDAAQELFSELGRSPRIDEIAARVDMGEDAVLECIEANRAYKPGVLDTPGSLTIASDEGSHSEVLDRELVLQLLKQLPEREQKILALRFYEGLSQSEIAERIGASQVHVGRLISSSLSRLRTLASGNDSGAG